MAGHRDPECAAVCCSAHQKVSQDTGKRIVERAFMGLHFHTFLKLYFY